MSRKTDRHWGIGRIVYVCGINQTQQKNDLTWRFSVWDNDRQWHSSFNWKVNSFNLFVLSYYICRCKKVIWGREEREKVCRPNTVEALNTVPEWLSLKLSNLLPFYLCALLLFYVNVLQNKQLFKCNKVQEVLSFWSLEMKKRTSRHSIWTVWLELPGLVWQTDKV